MALPDAIAGAGLPIDERGLVELGVARKLVESATEFRKGEGRWVAGSWVLDSDRLWAALLSLETVDEFVQHACRLRWYFHPRGKPNTDAIERYGPAILPWLGSFIKNGRLVDVPWCVVPCLLATGTREVFELLWTVRTVAEDATTGEPGPFAADSPGDVDQRGFDLDAPGPDDKDGSAGGILLRFAWYHPKLGFPELARKVEDGDRFARAVLIGGASVAPSEVFGYVREALGEPRARALFEQHGIPSALTEASILERLDAGASDVEGWPLFFGQEPDRAYHALRMLALRSRGSDDWAVLFECLEGSSPEKFCVRRYLYGTTGQGLLSMLERPDLFEQDSRGERASGDLDGLVVVGPCGEIELTSELVARLEPARSTAARAKDLRFTVRVRAYLEAFPDAFWPAVADSAALCRIEHGDVIVCTTAFEHVIGTASAAFDPEGIDAAWRTLPSESPAYRSLARALVQRDPAAFAPGPSNLDWRLHLRPPNGG
jgi:hypothetical protein